MGRSKKIICTVINDLSYDQRMHRVCTALVEAGYEVLLVGRVKGKSVKLSEQVFEQKRIVCMSESGLMMYMEYNMRLFLFLLFHRFDIVNAVDLDTIMPASMSARIKGKPMTYDAHELFTEVPEIVSRPYLQKFWSWIEKNFVPTAKRSYTVGPSLADIFAKKYQQTFAVIRNVPFRKITSERTVDQRVILYQGAINSGRGLTEMIAAMPSLDEDIMLWIVGDGDEFEKIKAAALGSTAKQRIKMWGYIEPTELKKITEQAWIGINLLENSGLSYYYSLANRTFDFIQAGLPAIHINFPEYAAINTQYHVAELIDDLRVESIVKAVQKLSDEQHYIRLKQNCMIAAAELCWEKEQGKLIDIYDSL